MTAHTMPRNDRVRGLLTMSAILASAACGPAPPSLTPARLLAPPQRPQFMYVSLAADETFHRVAIARYDDPRPGRL